MNDYKMIVCDLDGTLIDSEMTLSKENRQAIKELSDKRIMFVPATGRTLCEAKDVLKLREVRYIIYSNGAAIYDKHTGKTIFSGLDADDTLFVFDNLKKYDVFTILHRNGQSCFEKEKIKRIKDYHVSFNVEELLKRYGTASEDFESGFIDGGLESVVVFFANEDEYKVFEDIIATNPELHAESAWDHNLEIFSKDAGKGNALKILAQKLGVDMKDIISIGDSDNDEQMTDMAGLGLAVQNGCESLKKVADSVICSNDEHVLEYVKNNFFDI